MFSGLKRAICGIGKGKSIKRSQHVLGLNGFLPQNGARFVDSLSDTDLAELNSLLKWNCFTVDGRGRRFGNPARPGKRSEPQDVPDRRIVLLSRRFDLANKHVLEIGCFEGVHTIGLCRFAREVTAVDTRIENVVKTIVRCAFYDVHPQVFKWNIEDPDGKPDCLTVDIAYHVGVLYHLRNPVQHLLELGRFVRSGLMLDTHYALDQEATETVDVNRKAYRYKRFLESGHLDAFSGEYSHSKWLRLDDIVATLELSGFDKVEIVETRAERNGPRVLIVAERSSEQGVQLSSRPN
jgi:SAM-dependent methyltransferase